MNDKQDKQEKASIASANKKDSELTQAEKIGLQDESAATVREGERQAAAEEGYATTRAADAARRARSFAAEEETAPEATKTFWQKFKEFFTGEICA